jgi:arylsulfatase A-like enzyme
MLDAKSAASRFGSCRGGHLLRFLMLVSSLSALTVLGAEPPPATKYNLLLISIDTLRADHLKCYGYHLNTSPHLDQLAKEGVLFESVTAAASWTIPSHMSMFTSLYASVHGVQTFGGQLGEGVGTLAQHLTQSGYVTAAFVIGTVLDHRYGFNRGFQCYDDFTVGVEPWIHEHITNLKMTELATEWLKKHSQEDFFLFLHYFDCHAPYNPPAQYARRFDPEYTGRANGVSEPLDNQKGMMSRSAARHAMALYDGEIAFTDEHVSKILQLLKDLRLSEKTLVIVLSDHGEAFLEHGEILHGNSLYEEEIHVPLIMRLPGVIPAGKRIAGNVSHVDLMPTTLGLLQVKAPSQLQGIDLSPTILSDKPVPERLIYSELINNLYNLRAVRWGHRKLLGRTGTLKGAELEQVLGDREKVIAGVDLKKDCPEAVLQAFAEGPPPIPGASPGKTNEPDAERMRQLKSLGYTQ